MLDSACIGLVSWKDLNDNSVVYNLQDLHPPIPDGFSPDFTDFLHQCFKKVTNYIVKWHLFIYLFSYYIVLNNQAYIKGNVQDAMQRPDAKTLLLHPWIQNSRRALSSLQQTGGSRRLV